MSSIVCYGLCKCGVVRGSEVWCGAVVVSCSVVVNMMQPWEVVGTD